MPTPVEVSLVKLRGDQFAPHARIEALGGVWRGQPWSMSERSLVAEIEQPDDSRAWNFFVRIDRDEVPIIIRSKDGRKYLSAGNDPVALLTLPEMPRERALGWEA
jgi:hypothetical protein